MLPKPNHF